MKTGTSLSKKLALIARAEAILLRLRLRDLLIAVVCISCALCFLLIGLLVSHVAAFMSIQRRSGSLTAGSVIAGFDFLVALLLVAYAIKDKSGSKDKSIALDARNLTLESVQEDMAEISQELSSFRAELRRLQTLLSKGVAALSWGLSFGQILFDLLKSDSTAKATRKAGEQGKEPSTSQDSDSAIS